MKTTRNQRVFVGGFASANEAALGAFIDASIDSENQSFLPACRFQFSPSVAPSEAALSAAQNSLTILGIEKDSVDLVITSSQTPDCSNPGLISFLTARLGLQETPGLELKQGGAGLLFALNVARAFVAAGRAKRVLCVCADLLSRYFPSDGEVPRASQFAREIFADGASACVVVADSERSKLHAAADLFEINAIQVFTAPQGRDASSVRLPSASGQPTRITPGGVQKGLHFPQVDLKSVIAHYLHYMPPALAQWCIDWKLQLAELPLLVTHQPFGSLNNGLCRLTGLSPLAVMDLYETHGYLGSAGLGAAMAMVDTVMPPEAQHTVVLAAFGSGIHCGGAFLTRVLDG